MSCRQPRASSGGTIPSSARNPSFHAPGRSATASVPATSACSSRKRRMTCAGYVISSASTRMKPRSTRRHSRARLSGRYGAGSPPNVACSSGPSQFRKASERPACISTISDWLSCAAMPAASPTGWRCPALGQTALVQRVAGLVHQREHRLGEVGLVIARGDAHIARRTAGERMRRTVQPRMGEVETQTFGETAAQRFLHRNGKRRRTAAPAAGCAPAAPPPAAAPGAGTSRIRRTPW